MFSGLGLARRGLVKTDTGAQLPRFAASKAINPFISNKLMAGLTSPIFFKIGGIDAYGFPATILVDICEAVLLARDAGSLNTQQKSLAERCDILIRGLASVGIIALVDEATGYQAIRDRQALEKILDKYLRPYQARWAKRFPDEFYEEMFRLKGWEWQGMKINRPQVVGHYTNDIVYERLTDGLLKQLQLRNPTTPSGERVHKHHQWLTDDFGIQELREHMVAVIAIMKTVKHHNPTRAWDEFKRRLQRWRPRHNTTLELLYDDDD